MYSRQSYIEHFIPEDAEKTEHEDAKTVVYLYDRNVNGRIYHVAAAFGGRRNKPDLFNRFTSREERQKRVDFHLECQREIQEEKAERRRERNAHTTSLEVGDILYASWGYEQTNIDFYEVVEVKPSRKTIVIQEIGKAHFEDDTHKTGYLAEWLVPNPEQRIGDLMTKRVRPALSHADSVRIYDFARAVKWDGKPKYQTSYH